MTAEPTNLTTHGIESAFRTQGPEEPFVKLRPAYSVKLIFSHVVKGIKIKITAKFRASRRLRFEDTKRIMSPKIRLKSFGTFEKQAPGHIGGGRLLSPLCQRLFAIFHNKTEKVYKYNTNSLTYLHLFQLPLSFGSPERCESFIQLETASLE